MFRPYLYFQLVIILVACAGNDQQSNSTHTNKLIDESSPYLLQHAHNPVDWFPWGEDALAKARKEDKLVIVSIGYSSCHWCHVMEEQSFEDSTVAAIMNEHFVSIKVDREERPDVDKLYMTACQITEGRCGWPLNVFALPDGKPVWTGTYFPRKEWVSVLEYFVELYQKEPEKLRNYADQLAQGIQQDELVDFNNSAPAFPAAQLETMADTLLAGIDFEKGGQGFAPKFPMPVSYEFLLKYGHLQDDTKALQAVKVTLEHIARGGIYDHLGGGFARYSTDSEWHIPHFEKMLYDNAQLTSLFATAYKADRNPLYAKATKETLAFIEREMTNAKGGFYSSLDADSEGEEGQFYVWHKAEIDSILGDRQAARLFHDFYDVSEKGNWENGKNVLRQVSTVSALAQKYDLSATSIQQQLRDAKIKLFKARTQRHRPGRDNKVLTSWNALMLKGYVDAFQAFGEEAYRKAALRNAHFIVENMMQSDGRLHRNYMNGEASINAFLDDYAFTIQAFLALYEVTFDEQWLQKADELLTYTLEHFFHKPTGMFYYTSDLDPPLVTRKQEITDNVIPASNSVMAHNLYRLGLYFYQEDYLAKARQMLHNVAEEMTEYPDYYANWARLYLDFLHPTYEVAIVGQKAASKRNALTAKYLPNAIFLGGETEGDLQLLQNKLVEGKTMIYVCQNKICKLPVTEVEKALDLLSIVD